MLFKIIPHSFIYMQFNTSPKAKLNISKSHSIINDTDSSYKDCADNFVCKLCKNG